MKFSVWCVLVILIACSIIICFSNCSKKSTKSEIGSIEGSVVVFVDRRDANGHYIGVDTLMNLTGITIKLLNESKTSVVKTTRCVSGAYQFKEVKAGTYVVSAQVCDDIKMNGEYSQTIHVTAGKMVWAPTCFFGSYAEEDSTDAFWCYSPYPNPFDPREGNITITYFCSNESFVSLVYFYPNGDTVRVFESDYRPSGYNKLLWDGTDTFGDDVPAGIYFCKLEVNLTNPPYSKFIRVKNIQVADAPH